MATAEEKQEAQEVIDSIVGALKEIFAPVGVQFMAGVAMIAGAIVTHGMLMTVGMTPVKDACQLYKEVLIEFGKIDK